MAIKTYTKVPSMFLEVGLFRKGTKDAKGAMRDLDHYRVIYKPDSRQEEFKKKFEEVYGLNPKSVNIRFAFPFVERVWDAGWEVYKKGGLYGRADSDEFDIFSWVFLRDMETAEVIVRGGHGVNDTGRKRMEIPFDNLTPMYKTVADGKTKIVTLGSVGRLKFVVPELDYLGPSYFTLQVKTARDIRTISAELGAFDELARASRQTICQVPFILIRRPEEVTVNIKGQLSRQTRWMIHLTAEGEWGRKALEVMRENPIIKSIETTPVDDVAEEFETPDFTKQDDIPF